MRRHSASSGNMSIAVVIEINKNIGNYKESVVLGLSARQLVYSVLSVVAGGGIVLLLYQHVGLTVSTYIAIPVIAPIAMTGFYSYHGMTFMEMMKLKMHFAFTNHTYTYVSAGFVKARKGMFRMLTITALFIFLFAACAVWYKYR